MGSNPNGCVLPGPLKLQRKAATYYIKAKGYGAFLWKNPTDKAFKNWGLTELAKLIKKTTVV